MYLAFQDTHVLDEEDNELKTGDFLLPEANYMRLEKLDWVIHSPTGWEAMQYLATKTVNLHSIRLFDKWSESESERCPGLMTV